AVEKATGVLRLIGDLDKTQAEKAKLEVERQKLSDESAAAAKRERTDRRKDYVTMMTPFLSIITLAATLGWQSWQFVTSENNKRYALEDAQWDEANKTMSQSGNSPVSLILLKEFLKKPRYRAAAMNAALQLLAT